LSAIFPRAFSALCFLAFLGFAQAALGADVANTSGKRDANENTLTHFLEEHGITAPSFENIFLRSFGKESSVENIGETEGADVTPALFMEEEHQQKNPILPKANVNSHDLVRFLEDYDAEAGEVGENRDLGNKEKNRKKQTNKKKLTNNNKKKLTTNKKKTTNKNKKFLLTERPTSSPTFSPTPVLCPTNYDIPTSLVNCLLDTFPDGDDPRQGNRRFGKKGVNEGPEKMRPRKNKNDRALLQEIDEGRDHGNNYEDDEDADYALDLWDLDEDEFDDEIAMRELYRNKKRSREVNQFGWPKDEINDCIDDAREELNLGPGDFRRDICSRPLDPPTDTPTRSTPPPTPAPHTPSKPNPKPTPHPTPSKPNPKPSPKPNPKPTPHGGGKGGKGHKGGKGCKGHKGGKGGKGGKGNYYHGYGGKGVKGYDYNGHGSKGGKGVKGYDYNGYGSKGGKGYDCYGYHHDDHHSDERVVGKNQDENPKKKGQKRTENEPKNKLNGKRKENKPKNKLNGKRKNQDGERALDEGDSDDDEGGTPIPTPTPQERRELQLLLIDPDLPGVYNCRVARVVKYAICDETETPTSFPTPSPTRKPTPPPTRPPTKHPTPPPTRPPTPKPTPPPTRPPTKHPSKPPTRSPTVMPHNPPTRRPSPTNRRRFGNRKKDGDIDRTIELRKLEQ